MFSLFCIHLFGEGLIAVNYDIFLAAYYIFSETYDIIPFTYYLFFRTYDISWILIGKCLELREFTTYFQPIATYKVDVEALYVGIFVELAPKS
ncbi:hypothetical protein BAVI_25709 [Neobacillus vireti LMG 21834]|uniref:Uncharacterized protein n=1 Tax=Neobacillus vireti LMG 21834 TaxID=1131730 RepID=A0AB94IFD9_9BACI|nr:hypothetical protein BAVI_25709 [Neobacillus vireti LMG 21834]KLT18090.1 hypothetical protein AA980_10475 [Neobacillus vireti]